LIQDESQDQPPTDETPTPDEENVEPTTAPDEPPAEGEAPQADAPQEDAPQEEAPQEEAPQEEAPADEAPAEAEAPQAEAPAEGEAPQAEAPAEGEAPQERRPPRREQPKADEPEVIPGAHLEPDLVLEQPAVDTDADDYSQYAVADEDEAEAEAAPETEAATVRSPLELAADARYYATGKRKSAIARVTLKPGSGVYTINGKALEEYFPRERLQVQARQPLDATGNLARMDVLARIHGGGVSAQAGALRHGIARALVDAEPSLRTELKRRGYLTRDPREKERKKAGLKKARKRPQFSKR
jgi:small subunit ribosomal protein S9